MDNASAIANAKLPGDAAVLRGMVRELLALHAESEKRIAGLEHRLEMLPKRVYGSRADRVRPDQPGLFPDLPESEPEPAAPPPPADRDAAPPDAPKPRAQGAHGRTALPENLRRERVEVDVPEADELAFGGTWIRIGEEVSGRLDYTPSGLFVRQTVRPKYVVRFAREESRPDELKVAELPAEALPKSKAAPGPVADAVVSKPVDHLPLYRQERRYARRGSRSPARPSAAGSPRPPTH